MKPQLPGLGPIATLMLVPILAVWLGIAGPANLKDWQPLIASLVALGAAGLAYKAAMAKVSFEREQTAEDLRRRKLKLFLRLQHLMYIVRVNANHPLKLMKPDKERRTLLIRDLEITMPAEIEEAWSALDMFPPEMAFEIGDLRNLSNIYRQEFESFGGREFTIEPKRSGGRPKELDTLVTLAELIVESAKALEDWLDEVMPVEFQRKC